MAKKRGRPPGAKNQNYEIIDTQPPSCPTCGATQLKKKPGAAPIVKDISGVTRTGIPYNRVVWQRSFCKCGQHVMVRTYETVCQTRDSVDLSPE